MKFVSISHSFSKLIRSGVIQINLVELILQRFPQPKVSIKGKYPKSFFFLSQIVSGRRDAWGPRQFGDPLLSHWKGKSNTDVTHIRFIRFINDCDKLYFVFRSCSPRLFTFFSIPLSIDIGGRGRVANVHMIIPYYHGDIKYSPNTQKKLWWHWTFRNAYIWWRRLWWFHQNVEKRSTLKKFYSAR